MMQNKLQHNFVTTSNIKEAIKHSCMQAHAWMRYHNLTLYRLAICVHISLDTCAEIVILHFLEKQYYCIVHVYDINISLWYYWGSWIQTCNCKVVWIDAVNAPKLCLSYLYHKNRTSTTIYSVSQKQSWYLSENGCLSCVCEGTLVLFWWYAVFFFTMIRWCFTRMWYNTGRI